MIQTIATESLDKEKENGFINLASDFVNSAKNKTGFVIKSFFNSSVTWEEIVNLIHHNSKIQNEQLKKDVEKTNSKSSNIKEVVSGNVLIVDDLYFSVDLQKQESGFVPKDVLDIHDGIHSYNGPNQFMSGSGLIKVSIGSRFVTPHVDKWGAMVFQLTGQAVWTLSYPESKYEESFTLNPGDFLYFPDGMYHAIVSNSARSSIITPLTVASYVNN